MESLTDDDTWLLADLWQREDAAARRSAWSSAKAVIEARANQRALDDVRDAVATWMGAGRTDFQGIEGLLGRAGGVAGGRQAAAPAVIDAAAAILAAGGIEVGEEAVLFRPWRSLSDTDEGD
jgi:hypothetical protein